MYDCLSDLTTVTLKKDKDGELQLYSNFSNEEMSENWDFGTFLDENYTFEIVEEKLTDELKNALTVLGKYCEKTYCENCAFYKGHYHNGCCYLAGKNPYANYKKYVGEENE